MLAVTFPSARQAEPYAPDGRTSSTPDRPLHVSIQRKTAVSPIDPMESIGPPPSPLSVESAIGPGAVTTGNPLRRSSIRSDPATSIASSTFVDAARTVHDRRRNRSQVP